MTQIRYKYRRKRIVNNDGSVSFRKVRDYDGENSQASTAPSQPRATETSAVEETPQKSLSTVPVVSKKPEPPVVKSKGTVKVGNVTLPVNAVPNVNYVPEDQYLVGQDDILEAMALAVSQNKPVLLKGETGTGKTTLVHELAHRTNNSLRQINLNGNTTVDEIVGRTVLKGQGTEFIDGIMIDAMRNGHWLLLDELNAGLPEVLLALQQVLIDGKYTLVESDGEVVKAHPNFRVFGTMNPPETYIGTNHLNPATLSRFGVVIEVDYPDSKTEFAIIKSKLPNQPRTADSELSECIRLASDIRNGYAQQEYRFMLSTRDIISWCQINEHYGDLVKSAKYTILGKCNADDRKALESILKVYFSAELTVNVNDGQYNQTYRKGNLFQVCGENCDIFDARTTDFLGKAKQGTVIEVEGIKNGSLLGRVMRGSLLQKDPSNANSEEVTISHQQIIKIGDLTQVSTRRIDVK